MTGSSPRLWGTQPLQGIDLVFARFIPTAVGNASVWGFLTTAFPVHPHGCGERSWTDDTHTTKHGSSPRLWGTPVPPRIVCVSKRFIPTAVGNALRAIKLAFAASVHPHGCGERLQVLFSQNPHNGSSPRLWGTHNIRKPRHFYVRFIPTAVGNANSSFSRSILTPVHPHGCGERDGTACGY